MTSSDHTPQEPQEYPSLDTEEKKLLQIKDEQTSLTSMEPPVARDSKYGTKNAPSHKSTINQVEPDIDKSTLLDHSGSRRFDNTST